MADVARLYGQRGAARAVASVREQGEWVQLAEASNQPVRYFNNGVELRLIPPTIPLMRNPEHHPIDDPRFEESMRESLARYRRQRSRREGGYLSPDHRAQSPIGRTPRTASARAPAAEPSFSIPARPPRVPPPRMRQLCVGTRQVQPYYPDLASKVQTKVGAWSSEIPPNQRPTWQPIAYFRPQRGKQGGISELEYHRAHNASRACECGFRLW